MSRLIELRATFACDWCGREFSVRMDSTVEPCEELPTLYDLAVDAVRGSVAYDGPKQSDGLQGMSAVVGKNDDECLCGRCEEKERKRHFGRGDEQ